MEIGWILAIVLGSIIAYTLIGVFIGAISVNCGVLDDDTAVPVCLFFWPVMIWFLLGNFIYKKTRALGKKKKNDDKIPEGCGGGFIDCS